MSESSISLALSVASLVTAIYLTVRQYLLQRNSNSVPLAVELLKQLRDPGLHESYKFVIEELPSYDPGLGLSELPKEARDHVINISYFLLQPISLTIFGVLEQEGTLATFRVRAIAVWDAIEPFISTERLNKASGVEFFTPMEAFAAKARLASPEIGQKIIDRWLGKRPARIRSGLRKSVEAKRRGDQSGASRNGAPSGTPSSSSHTTQSPGMSPASHGTSTLSGRSLNE